MKFRIEQDLVAIGLSAIGLTSAVWLLGKALIELTRAVRCGDTCDHIEAGEDQ